MSCNVHVGDSLTINLTYVDCSSVVFDISGATAQTVTIKGPTTRLTKASSYVTDGTDGLVTVDFDAGDISETGTWSVQGAVTLPGSPALVYRSEIKTFEVEMNL